MKVKYLLMIVFSFLQFAAMAQKPNVKKAMRHAEHQTLLMLKEVADAKSVVSNPELVSPRTLDKGTLKLVASKDWTSGFFPGVLWLLYENSGNKDWLDLARIYSAPIEKEKTNGITHDMGFKIFCSIGSGYRLTKDAHYKEVIVEAANTLITRFNAKTGVIRSWDHNTDKWVNPVIIDNMMNLELLFEATLITGDSSYHQIAVSHANVTLKNHFRSDYSSYHVIDYDPATGKVLKKNTHQGYSHESAWSRGQAWALYGYAMCYRYTKDPAYLDQAKRIADYVLGHPNMPKNLVPYWDFNAPGIPNEPRDASAAAVIASGLLELAVYSKDEKRYRAKANTILSSLGTSYAAKPGEDKGFILGHSTGSKPTNSEVDVPLSYADYYYLEALLRSRAAK